MLQKEVYSVDGKLVYFCQSDANGIPKPQRCIKKVLKTSPNAMGVEVKANPGLIYGTNQRFISGSDRFFSIFFTQRESLKGARSSVAKGSQ